VSDASLWIFGYGSLVWRPAFAHRRAVPASIEGWARRFWQGSTDHRGLPDRPGRVVTLLPRAHPMLSRCPHPPEPCWGTAYEVEAAAADAVLAGLDHRERGGYARLEIEIRLTGHPPRTVPGLVYVATPENPEFLGPASPEAIARQIATARGPSGANPEYVFELARSLRAMAAPDGHVFEVEAALLRVLGEADGPRG